MGPGAHLIGSGSPRSGENVGPIKADAPRGNGPFSASKDGLVSL